MILVVCVFVVADFAKKTGDFAVLSRTDLKVLALAYELECQLGPQKGGNLREQPLQKVLSVLSVWGCEYVEACVYHAYTHARTHAHAHTCMHTHTHTHTHVHSVPTHR